MGTGTTGLLFVFSSFPFQLDVYNSLTRQGHAKVYLSVAIHTRLYRSLRPPLEGVISLEFASAGGQAGRRAGLDDR